MTINFSSAVETFGGTYHIDATARYEEPDQSVGTVGGWYVDQVSVVSVDGGRGPTTFAVGPFCREVFEAAFGRPALETLDDEAEDAYEGARDDAARERWESLGGQ